MMGIKIMSRGRGRPGGNPEIKLFGYGKSPDNPSDEPMALLALRLEKSLIERIKNGEQWQIKLRAKLREIYDADAE